MATMPDALTESFCERCGTRYEFAAPPRITPMRRTRGLMSGLKNYILSQDSLSDALGDAMRSQAEGMATKQLDAFHASFNFCIDCRQYTCTNCWNEAAGRCQSCQPLTDAEAMAKRFATTLGAVSPDFGVPFELGPEASAGQSQAGVAWPAADVIEPEPEPVPLLTWMLPEAEPEPDMEPSPVEAEIEPEPIHVEPEPEPVLVEAEAEPEALPVEPEPEPVLVEAEAEPEPLVTEPEPEPVLVEAEAEPEPLPVEPEAPEPVPAFVEAEVEPEAAPFVTWLHPEVEQEAAEVEPVAEPEPVLVEAEAEPQAEPAVEPEPMLVEAEAEPEPTVEPEPYRPLRPVTDTFMHYPRPVPVSDEEIAAAAALAAAAETDAETLAARRAQLDLLGLGDPGQGPVGPARPVLLPYRVRRSDAARRGAAGRSGRGGWRCVLGCLSARGGRRHHRDRGPQLWTLRAVAVSHRPVLPPLRHSAVPVGLVPLAAALAGGVAGRSVCLPLGAGAGFLGGRRRRAGVSRRRLACGPGPTSDAPR